MHHYTLDRTSDPYPSEALRNGLNGRFLTGPRLSVPAKLGPSFCRIWAELSDLPLQKSENSDTLVCQFTVKVVSTVLAGTGVSIRGGF